MPQSGVQFKSDSGEFFNVTTSGRKGSPFFIDLEGKEMGIISVPTWAVKKILDRKKVHLQRFIYRGNGKMTCHHENKSLSFPVGELEKLSGHLKTKPKSVERRSGFRSAKAVSK
jgi:rhodanese-related sulfurtransferase